MTIRFRCECGRMLMASDDQAGLEGRCPACGRLVPIPQVETASLEEPRESVSEERFDEQGTGEEGSMEIKELEELERGEGGEAENQPEKRNWMRSPRFAMFASILVVVVVALVVFMVVRKERQTPEDVVVIEKIQPLVETEEETPAPPVGGRLDEEEADFLQPQEVEPVVSSTTGEESIEQVPAEPPAGVETEVVPAEEEKEVVASVVEEAPPTKRVLPIGAFVINVASFRKRESATRYVEELKKKGIEAFDWEVNLPQKGRWYRVSVGGFATRREAENYANGLRKKGISDTFITKVPGAS